MVSTKNGYRIRKHPRIAGNWESGHHWADVYAFEGDRRSCAVRVQRGKDIDAETWNDATVSWASLGEVTLDQAEAFANAILAAVTVGRGMQE